MKKIMTLLTVLIMGMIMVMPFSVFAATESDVISKLSETQTINGKSVSVKSDVLNQVKNYLNNYDLTDAECQVILDNIDLAIAKAKEEGATKWSVLSTTGKNKMIEYLNNITSATTINATLTSDGTLTVMTPDGRSVFCKIKDAVVDSAVSSSTTIVNTGVTSIAVIIIAIVAAAGCVVVTKNVSKANA